MQQECIRQDFEMNGKTIDMPADFEPSVMSTPYVERRYSNENIERHAFSQGNFSSGNQNFYVPVRKMEKQQKPRKPKEKPNKKSLADVRIKRF